MNKIICLMGPTASGKTALACKIYDQIPADIISVDSVLIYKDMNIGSGKPTADELVKYPHELIDICDPVQTYSAFDFVQDVKKLIQKSHENNRAPILVGGTMMYFYALQQEYFAENNKELEFINILCCPDRAELHKKINNRFLEMLDLGLVAEVEKLYQRGDLHLNLPSMRSVGYRQVWQHLDGEYNFDEMILRAQAATRQLAKRQYTWMNKWPNDFKVDSFDKNIEKKLLADYNLIHG